MYHNQFIYHLMVTHFLNGMLLLYYDSAILFMDSLHIACLLYIKLSVL